MSATNTDLTKPEPGYTIIGFVTANLGLGVAARNTVAHLLESGRAVRVIDVDPGFGRKGADQTFASLISSDEPDSPAINIFHMNPLEVVGMWRQWRAKTDFSASLNVCVPFWELPDLPPSWVPALECMDYVLAPTLFIQEACRRSLPADRVLYYPQTIALPDGIAPDRARWSLPDDATLFMVTFDINSDVERKNPWAAIDCFSEAFPGNDAVRLVVRMNGKPATPVMQRQMDALRDRVAEDHRIVLVEGSLEYREILSLYASCDALISLHRSEGLGLHLMEAMALGKPVIATGWSGNMDFMDDESACLVPYVLAPVAASQPSYAPEMIGDGQVWAEPDRDAAIAHLRQLASEPEMCERIGNHARERIRSFNREARKQAPFTALDAGAVEFLAGPRRTRASERRLKRLIRATLPPWHRVAIHNSKRWIVTTLRKLKLYPPGP